MTSTLVRAIFLTIAIVTCHAGLGRAQVKVASWLNESKPASWNKAGLSIPAAPRVQGDTNPRCREKARPPELKQDNLVREQGWYLDGAYQGGWEVVVIRGTASYDGMCRPSQYQDFVFVRSVFAGTLSPQAMDSRTDGALTRVSLQSDSQLTAEYARYAEKDALCCPSRTTSVVFQVARDGLILRPVSASPSSKN